MRKMEVLIGILVASAMLSMTSYAGQWKQDAVGYWYEDDAGGYKTGWYQDADNKWYYFDIATGYMLVNTVTPDGYVVDGNGVWIETDVDMMLHNESMYDNKIEIVVTSSTIDRSTYELPVTIYYNNEYTNRQGKKVYITSVELSRDGIPYIKYSMSEESFMYDLVANCKYELSDGTYLDERIPVIAAYCNFSGETGSEPLRIRLAKQRLESAEVCIDADDTDQ